MEQIWNDIKTFFSANGVNLVIALSVAIIGSILIIYLVKGLKAILYRTKIDDSVVIFLTSIIKLGLLALLIFVCASILKLTTSSLLVCLSSIALAVGLALKDSLANLANGFSIISNKLFKRGDHISINGIEGKVQNVKLYTTELITFDNKKLTIPNSKFTTDTVINYSAMPTRRVDRTFCVSYKSDIDLVQKTIIETIKKDKRVLNYPAPEAFLNEHADSSLIFIVKCWTLTEDYWPVYNSMPTSIFHAFSEKSIEIPFNQLDVHIDNTQQEQKENNNEKKSSKK